MCGSCNFCGEPLNAVGDGLFGICITQQCKDERAAQVVLQAQLDAQLAADQGAPVLSSTVVWIIVAAVLIFAVGIFLIVRKKR